VALSWFSFRVLRFPPLIITVSAAYSFVTAHKECYGNAQAGSNLGASPLTSHSAGFGIKAEYYPDIVLKELRKVKENSGQNNQYIGTLYSVRNTSQSIYAFRPSPSTRIICYGHEMYGWLVQNEFRTAEWMARK
jgi:hypothetical protein